MFFDRPSSGLMTSFFVFIMRYCERMRSNLGLKYATQDCVVVIVPRKDNRHFEQSNESGNILFASLMLLLVMNLLGVGLMQDALKEQKMANFKRLDNTLFHLTESCARDAMAWLKGQNRPASSFPYVINYADVSHLMDGNEPQELVNQMQGYGYNCTVNELISKTSDGEDAAAGESIGISDGYDGSGDLSPKFFYEIAASGIGPDGASKQITTLVSVTY